MVRHHWLAVIQGSLAMVVCYALFYISTVFALGYGVGTRHFAKADVLALLCIAVIAMAAATPLSAAFADRFGRKPVLMVSCLLAAASGFLMPGMLGAGSMPTVLAFLAIELGLMGLTFAPMGALLPELFPTRVRYTGASTAYNIGGILGASLAPSLARWLLERGGLFDVGLYVTTASLVSFTAIASMRETAGGDLPTES
jgi:MFS family permease